jgi:hypothetical protein
VGGWAHRVESIDSFGDDDDEGGADEDAHADCAEEADLGLGERDG